MIDYRKFILVGLLMVFCSIMIWTWFTIVSRSLFIGAIITMTGLFTGATIFLIGLHSMPSPSHNSEVKSS